MSYRIRRSDGLIYSSEAAAACHLCVTLQAVSKAVRTGTSCMGFTFERIGGDCLKVQKEYKVFKGDKLVATGTVSKIARILGHSHSYAWKIANNQTGEYRAEAVSSYIRIRD